MPQIFLTRESISSHFSAPVGLGVGVDGELVGFGIVVVGKVESVQRFLSLLGKLSHSKYEGQV